MANEILLPIKSIPSFEELVDIVINGFNDFFIPIQNISISISIGDDLNLSSKFIELRDYSNNYSCVISFQNIDIEIREENEKDLPVIAGINAIGTSNFKFSIILSYIIAFSLGGRVIYDDAHLIQDKDTYLLSEFFCLAKYCAKHIYNTNSYALNKMTEVICFSLSMDKKDSLFKYIFKILSKGVDVLRLPKNSIKIGILLGDKLGLNSSKIYVTCNYSNSYCCIKFIENKDENCIALQILIGDIESYGFSILLVYILKIEMKLSIESLFFNKNILSEKDIDSVINRIVNSIYYNNIG